MQGRSLKERLDDGDSPVYGTICLTPSPEYPSAVKSSGVDFVFIDTEHVALPRDKLSWMCRTYDALGITPIVRVPEPEPYRVCEYLDGGAVGIIAPYVETVEQVLNLVGAVKLLPLKGEKLQQCLNLLRSPQPAQDGRNTDDLYASVERVIGGETASYLREKNRRNILFLNIESLPAIDRLQSILMTPGVDGVCIGPQDLSIQLDVPSQWESAGFLDAVSNIIRISRSCGRSVGCYSCDGAPLVAYQRKWIEAGANVVFHFADVVLFGNALKDDLTALKAK